MFGRRTTLLPSTTESDRPRRHTISYDSNGRSYTLPPQKLQMNTQQNNDSNNTLTCLQNYLIEHELSGFSQESLKRPSLNQMYDIFTLFFNELGIRFPSKIFSIPSLKSYVSDKNMRYNKSIEFILKGLNYPSRIPTATELASPAAPGTASKLLNVFNWLRELLEKTDDLTVVQAMDSFDSTFYDHCSKTYLAWMTAETDDTAAQIRNEGISDIKQDLTSALEALSTSIYEREQDIENIVKVLDNYTHRTKPIVEQMKEEIEDLENDKEKFLVKKESLELMDEQITKEIEVNKRELIHWKQQMDELQNERQQIDKLLKTQEKDSFEINQLENERNEAEERLKTLNSEMNTLQNEKERIDIDYPIIVSSCDEKMAKFNQLIKKTGLNYHLGFFPEEKDVKNIVKGDFIDLKQQLKTKKQDLINEELSLRESSIPLINEEQTLEFNSKSLKETIEQLKESIEKAQNKLTNLSTNTHKSIMKIRQEIEENDNQSTRLPSIAEIKNTKHNTILNLKTKLEGLYDEKDEKDRVADLYIDKLAELVHEHQQKLLKMCSDYKKKLEKFRT
eukprot:TRINITY_DN3151_c0_g1_i1.p1 TRINITY_DN3151_c0_g1~~TRINITY_DN3151_c0_g1_i1.p1  ORF type:complete len:563 (+),score=169.78 TRINITY_DN3151_c0_g1_i1:891-2579(+)